MMNHLMIWILFLIIPDAKCLLPRSPSKSEVLRGSQEAVLAMLEDSWLPGCSLIFIVDGSTTSTTISQFSKNLEGITGSAVFEFGGEIPRSIKGFDLSYMMEHYHQIRKTSAFSTLIVVSDEEEFLASAIGDFFDQDLIPWPSRLLVVTRARLANKSRLRKTLSQVNGMVFTLDDSSPHHKKCDASFYLPFSQRRVLVASWTPTYGLTYHGQERAFPNKFKVLRDGGHIVVAAVAYPPHTFLKFVTNDATGQKTLFITGPAMQVMNLVAQRANFTYTAATSKDRSFGIRYPNGTWNGLVSMVMAKEAEIGVGPMAITYLRWTAVDFTDPLFVDSTPVHGLRGDAVVDAWSFVLPLAPSVWAAVAAIFMLLLLTASLLHRLSLRKSESKGGLFKYHRILLHQDLSDTSIEWWERMLVGGWLLTALVLMLSYSSNLMSQLAVRHISQPYQSLRIVLDTPNLKMIWVTNTSLIQYIKEAKRGIFYEVAQSEARGQITFITSAEFVTSINKLVSQGGYVSLSPYLSSKVFLTERFTDKGRCKYYMSKERYLSMTCAIIAAKNSPLLPALNEGVRAAFEGGLYNYWMGQITPIATGCKNPPTTITVRSSLSITNLWGMFLVLILGLCLSSLIFGCEIGKVAVFPSSN